MASLLNDPKLEAILDRLHAKSDTPIDETNAYFEKREQELAIDHEDFSKSVLILLFESEPKNHYQRTRVKWRL